jgi:PAS domain S-box-containing protein
MADFPAEENGFHAGNGGSESGMNRSAGPPAPRKPKLQRWLSRIRAAVGAVWNRREHASERRFRDVVSSFAGWVWETEATGVYTYASDRVTQTLGYTPEEMIGRSPFDLMPPGKDSWVRAKLAELIEEKRPISDLEIRLMHKDGRHVYVAMNGIVLFNDDGTILGYRGVAIDITRRKETEAALREREEQLHLFVEHAPAAIAMFDAGMHYLVASQRWLTDYGLKGQNLRGRIHYEVFPEIPERWKEVHRRCLAGAVEGAEEELFVRADGTEQWLRWEVRPWITPAAQIGGILIFSEDVTERKSAQERLRQLSVVVEQSPSSIVITDPAGIIEYVNPKFIETTGYSPEEAVGRNPRLLKSGEQPEHLYRDMWNEITSGRMWRGELHNRKRNGELYWEEAIISPIVDERGKISHFVAIKEDITARKQAEATLQAREEQLSNIVATSPGVIYSFRLRADGSACLPFASQRIEEIFGLAAESLREEAAPIFAFVHPEDISRIRESIATSAWMMQPWHEEFRVRHPVKGEIWVEGHSMPQLERDGSILWHGVVQDVTERKRAEAEVRWKTAFLEAEVDSAPDAILVVDSQGKKLLQNQKLIDLFEVPASIVADADDSKLLQHVVHQTKNPETFSARVSALYADPDAVGRDEVELANGTILDRYSAPVRDPRGTYYGRIWTFRDITESRTMEAQFRQSQKMEAIGQLAGGVAHDFNNLLSVITGYSELTALRLPKDSPEQESLAEILHAAQHAASLTRQLLVFSRQEVVEPKVLDLNAAVSDSEKMLRRLIGEDVELTTQLDPRLSAIKIDPGYVTQIIMNLAVNARDAMPQGGKLSIATSNLELDAIFVRSHPGATPGTHVQLTISDTGCGMPPEVRARIFEPFFTTKGLGRGTGLGLSVVHGIVKQAGGCLDVDSEVSMGTTLRIYLPAIAEDLSRASVAEPARKASGGETILLVEDDEPVRKLTCFALEHLGYQVIPASGGADAMRLVEEQAKAADLLLVDVVMPVMSGRQLADSLRERFPTLKVLFQSGYTDDAVVRHGVLQSEVAFLHKPFTLAALATKVREVLDRE